MLTILSKHIYEKKISKLNLRKKACIVKKDYGDNIKHVWEGLADKAIKGLN